MKEGVELPKRIGILPIYQQPSSNERSVKVDVIPHHINKYCCQDDKICMASNPIFNNSPSFLHRAPQNSGTHGRVYTAALGGQGRDVTRLPPTTTLPLWVRTLCFVILEVRTQGTQSVFWAEADRAQAPPPRDSCACATQAVVGRSFQYS